MEKCRRKGKNQIREGGRKGVCSQYQTERPKRKVSFFYLSSSAAIHCPALSARLGSCSPQVQNLATVNKEEINHCSPIS